VQRKEVLSLVSPAGRGLAGPSSVRRVVVAAIAHRLFMVIGSARRTYDARCLLALRDYALRQLADAAHIAS